MKVSQLKKELKGMKDDDEVVFWDWDREHGSRFFDLTPTCDPKRFKGFLMIGINGYGPIWEVKDKKMIIKER